MKHIAKLPDDERRRLFELASITSSMHPAIIEKDFWVCYTLDHLFHATQFGDRVIFKGGTSLSKAYGLISRFSEDIDLILDWRLIGYELDEPWAERSNTKQDKFKIDSIERTDKFLAEVFAPHLKQSITSDIGQDADIYIADEEETVIFAYPRTQELEATLSTIRLEIGPLAAWTPSETTTITSYLAQELPEAFTSSEAEIRTVKPERTFWEKATILHQEANRPEEKKMPTRYSRHYYDLYQLGKSFVKSEAMGQPELLDRVAAFKIKFYRTPWSRLEKAKVGTLKLVPPSYRLDTLSNDYAAMQDMLFGEVPSFDEIITYLQELENEINAQ